MEHFFYSAYGLSIGCEFALPELTLWAPVESSAASLAVENRLDVRFSLADTPYVAPSGAPTFSGHIRRQDALLCWPGVGRFHIQGGQEARIEAAPGVAHATLRAFLLGPVLAITLYQRGYLVMHASAVAMRDARGEWGALGFLGHSGAGKSTMAAALHARGHRVVSDDIVVVPILQPGHTPLDCALQSYGQAPPPVDPLEKSSPALLGANQAAATSPISSYPPIFPGFPQLRLWPQALTALGEDASALPLLYPQEERRIRPVTQGFDTASLPLRALFVLQSGDALQLQRFTASQALFHLVEHTYCIHLEEPGEAAAQFRKCGALAQTLPVWGLQRPKDLERLADVAAFLETNWSQGESNC